MAGTAFGFLACNTQSFTKSRKNNLNFVSGFVLAATLLFSLCSFAQQADSSSPSSGAPDDSQVTTGNKVTVTIPAGTRIALVLTQPVQTRYMRRGDDIYAQINAPVSSGSEVVIPPGTFVQGKFDRLERKGGRGELRLQAMLVTFADGYVAPVPGPITMQTDEGYALKDPGNGRILGAVALPLAGAGLGALIGHAADNPGSTTTTFTTPPNCGVPMPGCTNGTSQSITTPGNSLKGVAIGSMVGLAAGGIASIVLLTHSHHYYLDVGSPVEMVLQQPLTLDVDAIAGTDAPPASSSDEEKRSDPSTQMAPSSGKEVPLT